MNSRAQEKEKKVAKYRLTVGQKEDAQAQAQEDTSDVDYVPSPGGRSSSSCNSEGSNSSSNGNTSDEGFVNSFYEQVDSFYNPISNAELLEDMNSEYKQRERDFSFQHLVDKLKTRLQENVQQAKVDSQDYNRNDEWTVRQIQTWSNCDTTAGHELINHYQRKQDRIDNARKKLQQGWTPEELLWDRTAEEIVEVR